MIAAGAKPESKRFSLHVVDDYGTRRPLTKSADCDCFEGVHDIGNGPEPYTLPAGGVAQWRRVAP